RLQEESVSLHAVVYRIIVRLYKERAHLTKDIARESPPCAYIGYERWVKGGQKVGIILEILIFQVYLTGILV
ncbi:hypothetical protein, partial [Pradoshia sp.]